MPKLIKKRSRKAGLPPGTPVHIGEKKTEKIKITLYEYDEVNFQEKELENLEACFSAKRGPTVTWVNIDGVHEERILQKLGDCFKLHPLVLEDILNTDQRPKIEEYGEDLFVVLKALTYNEQRDEISAEQISLILRTNFVMSFREKESEILTPIQEQLRSGKGRLRKMGADYLAYALMDIIVDHYFLILEKLGEKIELLEEKLVADPTASTLQKIQKIKKEMIFFRKWTWPLREVLSRLERGESVQVREGTRIFLRDAYDHTIQVIETIETFREMLSEMMDIYLSSLNNRMNAVMKVLTIIATIFMPLTFIAGVYGMNFRYIPELEWRFGYPMVLLLMALIVVFMLYSFWKKRWF